MSCVVCESHPVHLKPAVDVLVVPYNVRIYLFLYCGPDFED